MNKRNILIGVIFIFFIFAAVAALFFSGGQKKSFVPSLPNAYQNAVIGFSFEYPVGAEVRNISEGGDANNIALIVKNKNGQEMQVNVSPFDEDISLTVERIKADIPAMVINNDKILKKGSGQAVYFETENTREVWFVAGRYLYQVSASPTPREFFDAVSTSFSFEK